MAFFQKAVRLNALWVFLCAAAVCSGAEAGLDLGGDTAARPPKPEISVSQRSVAAGQVFEIITDFKLDKTVKLYRDELRFEWTTLEGASLKEVVFPAAERVPDLLAEDKNKMIDIYHGQVRLVARLVATGKPGSPIVVVGSLYHQSCTDTICFRPAEEAFRFELVTAAGVGGPPAEETAPARASEVNSGESGGEGFVTFVGRIVLAFLGGLAMSLTPCVYPMIPITAAVIGARKKKGLASAAFASLVYVMGLAVVYAFLGLLVAKLGSAVATFLQRPVVLVPVAAIFAGLAVVMFAGLNFAVPTGFAGRVQSLLAGKKGILATLGLGAVSGLVAGPCVAAPLAGVLIFIANSGDLWLGFWMLFALAWGMGIPLIVFGTATGLLPKAGAWTEWFKKLLGFVLLWAAFFFLAPLIGDAAYQVGCSVLLVAAAIFLGGFNLLTRESTFGDRLKKLLGVVAVLYAVYLFLSGMGGFSVSQTTGLQVENLFKPATAREVEQAIAAGRPVVIDFYAEWCAICKVLDKKVFTKPEVVEAAKGLAAFKVDIDKEPALGRRFGVFRPPMIVFVGTDGRARSDLSFAGEKSLSEFVKLLERFKGPAPEK